MKRAKSGAWTAGSVRGAAVVLAMLSLVGSRPWPVGAKQMSPQQQMPGMPGQPVPPSNPLDTGPDPAATARLQEQRQHALDDERRKRIVADTDKLLELATELKAEVDKSTKNEMSIAVIEKAAQIEKLSHDVKERMKN